MSDSILEAVTKANNTIVEEEGKATQVVATTSETTTEPVTEEVPEEKEEELKLDKRTTDALGILDLLENPETASEFIRQLATKAGYKLDATSTPSEVKKAVKSAAEVIKEKLGDNYEFFQAQLEMHSQKFSNNSAQNSSLNCKNATYKFLKRILLKSMLKLSLILRLMSQKLLH